MFIIDLRKAVAKSERDALQKEFEQLHQTITNVYSESMLKMERNDRFS